ncbi:MAG: exopolysaccharide biosynthesis polyprenyl glycosylphosphotransferase [Candidatus Korobacteraceae bacterium]
MSLRLSSQRFYFRFWIYSLPLIAILLSAYVRFYSHLLVGLSMEYEPRFYVVVILLTTLMWILVAEQNHLCQVDDLFQEYTGIKKVFSSCATTYVILMCALFFYRQQTLSRTVFGMSAVLLFVLALLSRLLFRNLLRGDFGLRRRVRILMIGADREAQKIATRLSLVPFVHSEVVGCVRLQDQDIVMTGVPVFEVNDLSKGLFIPFDDVIIAVPPERLASLASIVCLLEPLCAPIRTVLDFGDIPIVRERLFRFGDLQMLDLASTPVESPHYFLLKRAFDLGFSTLAVVLTAPFMLVIAGLIKLMSSGPILFRQERVGLNGTRFRMYKFRTMRESSREEGDTRWTTASDDRRTPIGSFLRKFSLDELPQFFNVLKGDMSVVGPRPERPYFVEKFLAEVSHYDTRHRLKVGITGWAQVNGWRGDTSIAKRLEFDRYYLQNWTLWFDFRIVLLTIWAGLFGRNAY